MNKLFEAVPVSEKPPIIPGYPNGFICLLSNGGLDERWWIEEENGFCYWSTAREQYELCDETIGWLRPIPPPTKEAERSHAKELEDIYTEWTKSTKRNGGVLIGSSIHEFIKFASEKISAKGHQEASTGQAGEARTVKSMLESIEIIGELAKEMTELKLETANNSPLQIIHNIGMAIEVFVKEVNKALSSTPSHTVEDDAQKQIKELHAKLIRSAGLTRYGHETLPINCVPGTENLFNENDKAVGYLRGEYELQVEKMKAIGINVESMFFEQCVNTLLFMYENQIKL